MSGGNSQIKLKNMGNIVKIKSKSQPKTGGRPSTNNQTIKKEFAQPNQEHIEDILRNQQS